MRVLYTTIIILHISIASCKRRYRDSSSEESIENVLYYQDCQHKNEKPKFEQLRALVTTTTTKKPQECKMCCTMCCGDECQTSVGGKTMPMKPQVPRQPVFMNRQQMKKIEPSRPNVMRNRERISPAFFGRRDLGLSKDNIKSLISRDMDIRKILKDLVRVTMQKVDLMQLMKSTESPMPSNGAFDNDL